MPIVTAYHRIDFSILEGAEVDAYFAEVREILAEELGRDAPGHVLDANADFEFYLERVGHRPGEHVTWDVSLDIEAYDFDYRVSDAEGLARAIMNRSSDAFARRFETKATFAVWLKLLTAAWVQSRQ